VEVLATLQPDISPLFQEDMRTMRKVISASLQDMTPTPSIKEHLSGPTPMMKAHPITPFNSTGPNQFLIYTSGGVGIGTNSPNEMLVVGDDLGGPFPGNRVTIGNKSGHSGINLGEDNNQRAFILWHNTTNHLEIGTTNQRPIPGPW
jgi:hypothetical protein